jgi:hypothetical protein
MPLLRNVLAKLLFFAVLVAVVPIATYFVTIDRVWDGKRMLPRIQRFIN